MKGEPAGFGVLIKPDKIEEKDAAYKAAASIGFDLSQTNEYKREKNANTTGTVLQIGHSAWWSYDKVKDGVINPDWKPWCKVGDRVLFARHTALFVKDPDTGEELWLINDSDVKYVFGETNE